MNCICNILSLLAAPATHLRSLGTSASASSGASLFDQPWGIALDSARRLLFVCDRGNSRVLCFRIRADDGSAEVAATGTGTALSAAVSAAAASAFGGSAGGALSLVWQYGTGTTTATPNASSALNMPRGCALSEDALSLAVVDAENNRVVVLRAADGALLAAFAADDAAVGTTPMRLPSCVTLANGKMWVSDASNHRVACFDAATHRYLTQLGQTEEAGAGDGQFTIPSGVAVHRGFVFVSDFRNHRVQIFDEASGAHVAAIGGAQGTVDGQLAGPEGLAIDHGRGLLYVCEGVNRRVSVFDAITLAFCGKIAACGNAGGGGGGSVKAAEFQYPIGVCVDPSTSQVYVSDFKQSQVHVFAAF